MIMQGNQEERNKAFVEKMDMAFSAGDTGFIISHMHNDVVWEMVGDSIFSGKKEVEKIIASMGEASLPEITQTRITAEANRVVAEGFVRATTKEGSPFEAAYCDCYVLEDGKIRKLRTYLVELKGKGAQESS